MVNQNKSLKVVGRNIRDFSLKEIENSIEEACTGEISVYRGSIWRFEGDEITKKQQLELKRNPPKVPVYKLNKVTLDIMASYESIKDAEKAVGIIKKSNSIKKCCDYTIDELSGKIPSGMEKVVAGYRWAYN